MRRGPRSRAALCAIFTGFLGLGAACSASDALDDGSDGADGGYRFGSSDAANVPYDATGSYPPYVPPPIPDATVADADVALDATADADDAVLDASMDADANLDAGADAADAADARPVYDNDPSLTTTYVDLGFSELDCTNGLLDDVNNKLLIVSSGATVLSLTRCNRDGTACTTAALGVTQQPFVCTTSTIDPLNHKLLIEGVFLINNKEVDGLVRCDLDGTNCTFTSVFPELTRAIGVLTLLADTTNQRLLTVYESDKLTSGNAALADCALDGTGCSYADLSAGKSSDPDVPTAGNAASVIDPINGKLLVITDNSRFVPNPSLFRANLDGSGATWADVSAGYDESDSVIAALVDTTNRKLLIVGQTFINNVATTALTRCELDGTACALSQMTAGSVGTGVQTPTAAAIDPIHKKLFSVISDNNNGSIPLLLRCELDGTSCVYADVSANQPVDGRSVVVDPANSRVFVLAGDVATNRAALLVVTSTAP